MIQNRQSKIQILYSLLLIHTFNTIRKDGIIRETLVSLKKLKENKTKLREYKITISQITLKNGGYIK
jgi:hypothetical protein